MEGGHNDCMYHDHMHKVLGHLGALRMVDYIHRWYWWPGLSKEVDQFC